MLDGPRLRGVLNYRSGATMFLVYASQYAGTNQATSASWDAGDEIDDIVTSLRGKGITFEHYTMPDTVLDGDIHVSGNMRVAWFKDPDGKHPQPVQQWTEIECAGRAQNVRRLRAMHARIPDPENPTLSAGKRSAGVSVPFVLFDGFIEARYHHVNQDIGSMAFVPITVGVMFQGIMPHRRHACALTAALAFLAAGCATTTPYVRDDSVRVETDTVNAASLGRRVAYNVVLPSGYEANQRYPVLWLLHGYSGGKDDWLRRTDLLKEIERYPFIVVLPSAENSWYVNAPSAPDAAYETFITVDLYNDVIRRFSIDTTRQAIAGLSMGGYGAVMLGLRHPHRYRFVGGLSAALSVASVMGQSDTVLWKGTGKSILKAFGSGGVSSVAQYDPLRIFRRTMADSLPYVFLAIGTHDDYPSFLPSNRAFTDSLRAYGARYEYHEIPGRHSWILWGAELEPMLNAAWRVLHAVTSCPDTIAPADCR